MRRATLLVATLAACSGTKAPHVDDSTHAPDARPTPTATVDAARDADGARSGYHLAPTAGGTLEVHVQYANAPAALRASPGLNACGLARPAPLQVGTLWGVAGALVRLNLAAGRALPPAAPVEIVVHDCELSPIVVVAPRLPAVVRVVNGDARHHTLALTTLGDDFQGWPAFAAPSGSIALPWLGSTVETTFTTATLARLAVASAPDDPVLVWAPGTTGVGVTDVDGVVKLGEVPAGTYALVVGKPLVGPPPGLTADTEVTIVDGVATVVTLDLGTGQVVAP